MRILAIDYGTKRCGLAWTDPLQLIATRLDPIGADKLMERLVELIAAEPIETVVLGWPTRAEDEEQDTNATAAVRKFAEAFQKRFPKMPLVKWDEAFTSKRAREALLQAGAKKKQRQDKWLINSVAATVLLQDYMENR